MVLAYNIPGITNLVLTRQNIVGIYNGSITNWNDISLSENNPYVLLPNEEILPVARYDKSGTTEIFTSALSSFSEDWDKTYGTFSYGIGADGLPVVWNASVVKIFASRIYGVTDEIGGNKYSIGYTTSYLATKKELHWAKVVNYEGYVVDANITTVQAAMDAVSMTSNLTIRIVDAPGMLSYPIAGYTYLVMFLHSMRGCDSIVELVRYIEWFLTETQPRKDCEQIGMVPISDRIAHIINVSILKYMTCRKKNVYEMMVAMRNREQQQESMWQVPVAIIVPLFVMIMAALVSWITCHRCKYKPHWDDKDWDIPIEEIIFHMPTNKTATKSHIWSKESGSELRSHSENEYVNVGTVLHWPGEWKGYTIGLRVMQLPSMVDLNIKCKTRLMWMKSLIHTNVLRFYGLTMLDEDRYVISEYCTKGALNDILHDGKFNLNTSFKFSLGMDVAKGMAFLHNQGLAHANLRSANCLIDDK